MNHQNLNENLNENENELPKEPSELNEEQKQNKKTEETEKAEEKKKEKKENKSSYSGIVWFTAVILLILILLTTALVFSILHGFTLKEAPPRIEIDIEINVGLPSGEGSPWDTGTRPAETTTGGITPPETTTGGITPPETTTGGSTPTTPVDPPEFTRPYSTDRESNPNVDILDGKTHWQGNTLVDIFRASYENESGVLTVRSAYNDKVIAPGTANSYYFDIKNTGDIGVDYTVQIFAELTSEVSGESFLVPLEVRFYRKGGEFMIGSEDDYASMYDIDGLEQHGDLGRNRYVRYILDWQWPFEGNDELDTKLGNLAAEGGEIRVSLRLLVTATVNSGARGGTIIGK